MKKLFIIVFLIIPVLGFSQNRKFDKLLDKYDCLPYVQSLQGRTAYDFWYAVVTNSPRLKKTVEASEKGKETFVKARQKVSNVMMRAKYLGDNRSYITDIPFLDTLSMHLLEDLEVCKLRSEFNIRFYYDDYANAMADPDANIFVTSGLMNTQGLDYNSLLGIMAHECAHTLLFHVMQEAYETEEKYRKNQIAGAITAGVNVAAAGYAQAQGVQVDWDDVNNTTYQLADAAYEDAYRRFRFKYSREQELEADIIACRILDWIGVGAEHYIQALEVMNDDEVVSNGDRDVDHPTMAYRVKFLEYMQETRPLFKQ